MALFKKNQDAPETSFYDSEVLQNLRKKDGFTHAITLSLNVERPDPRGVEVYTSVTDILDDVLTRMQRDGYEIVDVKQFMDSLAGKKDNDSFYLLILYK
jgi:hypothetical protein